MPRSIHTGEKVTLEATPHPVDGRTVACLTIEAHERDSDGGQPYTRTIEIQAGGVCIVLSHSQSGALMRAISATRDTRRQF